MLTNNKINYFLLSALALMAFLRNIDYTAVNIILLTISNQLHSPISTIRWVLSGYMLAWAIFIIPAGKLINLLGIRRTCQLSLALFLMGSLLTGFAGNPTLLITGRILQGIGGAFYTPVGYKIICCYFPADKKGFTTGIATFGMGLGMALGPTLGGLISATLGWRWIFFINIPFCLAAWYVFNKFLPSEPLHKDEKFDLISMSTLSFGIISLIFALNAVGNTWLNKNTIFSAALSLVMFVIFIVREKKLTSPLLPPHVFKNKSYLGALIICGLEQYTFSSIIVLAAIYMQQSLGFSVLRSSTIFLSLSLAFAIATPLCGKSVDKFGAKKPIIMGLSLLALGCILFLAPANSFIILLAFTLMGLGMGTALSALASIPPRKIDIKEVGIASSIFFMFALIGNAFGIVISTNLYEKTNIHFPMFFNFLIVIFAILIAFILIRD